MAASVQSNGGERVATLKLSAGPNGQVLHAQVPSDLSHEDFAVVGRSALDLVKKLTGCNCMSGRISFVVEDVFAEAIRVELPPVKAGQL